MESTKDIKDILERLEKRIETIEAKLIPDIQERAHKGVSINELIKEKKPRNNVEKVLTIGFYLEKYAGTNGFTVEDIRKGFKAAREPKPSNINDSIQKNVRKALIMELEPGKKKQLIQFGLTNTGMEVITRGFSARG